jgi:hypothetical protein
MRRREGESAESGALGTHYRHPARRRLLSV